MFTRRVLLPALLLMPSAVSVAQPLVRDQIGLTVGATDNAAASQINPVPDSYLRADNTLTLRLEGARSAHTVAGQVGATRYLWQSVPSSFSANASATGRYEPTASLVLSLGASGGYFVRGSLDTSTYTGAIPPDVHPGAAYRFVNSNANENLSLELSPRWLLVQSAAGTYTTPVGVENRVSRNVTGIVNLALSRLFERANAGVTLAGGLVRRYTVLAIGLTPTTNDLVDATPHFTQLGIGGGYALLDTLSVRGSVGGVATRGDFNSSWILSHAGAASIQWTGTQLSVGATYDRAAHPSPYLGDVLIVERVGTNASYAFDDQGRWRLSGSASRAQSWSPSLVTAGLVPALLVYTAGVNIGIRPWAEREVLLGAGYLFLRQEGGYLQMLDARLPRFDRHNVMFTLSVGLPLTPDLPGGEAPDAPRLEAAERQ